MPFPSPREFPNLGIKTTSFASPALVGGFFATWEAQLQAQFACLLFFFPCHSVSLHLYFLRYSTPIKLYLNILEVSYAIIFIILPVQSRYIIHTSFLELKLT